MKAWRGSWLCGCVVALAIHGTASGVDVPGLERLIHLPADHPLSGQWVRFITQDRHGFLWLGTISGIHRYDGYSVKSFANDPEDPRSLPNNFVNDIYEDQEGVLWIATAGGLARLDRQPAAKDRGEFVTAETAGLFSSFAHDPEDPHSLIGDYVTGIAEDRHGELWVSTYVGVARFDRGTQAFSRFVVDAPEPNGRRVFTLMRHGAGGDLWFGGAGPVLLRFDEREQKLEVHRLGERVSEGFWRIADAGDGRLWAGSTDGRLFRYDPHSGESERFLSDEHSRGFITTLHGRPDGSLWIGTDKEGLLVLDPISGAYRSYRQIIDRSGVLSDPQISAIFADRSGVIWLGTASGIDKYVPSRARFILDSHRPEDPMRPSSDAVDFVTEDRLGKRWVVYPTGLERRDPSGRVEKRFLSDPRDPQSLPAAEIRSMHVDHEGDLWIATHQGLGRLDPDQATFIDLDLGPSETQIETIYRLASQPGTLWIGGPGGASRLDKVNHRLRHYPTSRAVIDMTVGADGKMWLATYGLGLMSLDPQTGEIETFLPDNDETRTVFFVAMYRDEAGVLWLGELTTGLYRFDPSQGEFENYRQRDGLASDGVLDVLADGRGDLWLQTERGLSRFDVETRTVTNYGVEDGVPRVLGSGMLSATGEVLFASGEGLLRFRPEELVSDQVSPAVAITDFLLLNRSTPFAARLSGFGDRGVPHLVLDHRDDIFAFEFAALHFAKPGKNRYRYMLEGFNPEWIETDARNRLAQYTTLPAGDYTFRVTAANPDGVWNEEGTAVRVTVRPPPWQTWWAYSLYALALITTVAGYVRSHRKELERERQVSHRLREVDRLKDDFLANTSHELRTPLYGMTGLAESLIDGATGELPAGTKANLAMIVASGRRLGHLVNDILDFSKLRHKSLELDRRPVELHSLVDVVLALSAPLAADKDLRLENAVSADLPAADADENRLQQILHNLVGNAVKFTTEGRVEVDAVVVGDRLEVRIRDTGIGIAPEHQERIFRAFEQADGSVERDYGGTGLGLAVTRQLVELHGGSIRVQSVVGEGAEFSFDLPISENEAEVRSGEFPGLTVAGATPTNETAVPPIDEPAAKVASAGALRILAVDDEPVNRQVMRNYLALESFELVTAASGEEALELIEEQRFDLVLLDVMMPKVSGYEVCRALREKYPKESLPVLFLTAKNQSADVVTGLSLGANDFLTKPVAKDEFLARLRPHLELLDTHRHLEELVEEKMSKIKVLEGILPICASCKKIRDDEGEWSSLETFIDRHSEAHFSHGICPDCFDAYYDRRRGD